MSEKRDCFAVTTPNPSSERRGTAAGRDTNFLFFNTLLDDGELFIQLLDIYFDVIYIQRIGNLYNHYFIGNSMHNSFASLLNRCAIVAILFMGLLFMSCSTVPLTGRKQLNLIPGSTMLSMSAQQYTDFLKTNKVSSSQKDIDMVGKVGRKIQGAVETYMAQNAMSDRLSGYKWEFNLVESAEVNAWCMPGGKVVVYTGIWPVTKDEKGLAVVLGHEIAHAIAEHGNERMTQGLITQFGGVALSEIIKDKPEETKSLWMTVFGAGAQYGVLLPFSRTQENEADHLGLIFMAMAGYDPNSSVEFWNRMAAQKGGNAPPEFLSTHPSDATRIANIKEELPEALKYYKSGK
jgi:predicted Zn-dependent protease